MNLWLSVIGSSNGLLCLEDHSGSYFLWNPSIQKAISVPRPYTEIRMSIDYILDLDHGFGYDPKTDDYKLVRLVYHGETTSILVEIYTLRTGAWRAFVKATRHPYVIKTCTISVFLNGALHWAAHILRDQGVFRNLIVSFDMEDEAFREVAMPKSLQGVKSLNVTLAVVDGLLALVPLNIFGDEDDFHSVWVMKEYGVAESWTKLFDIESLQTVTGFTKNGEVLLVKDGKLYSYEPNSQQYLDLHICIDIESKPIFLETYVESLVLLNIADGVLEN
jgi:F-box interacting protein